jgi:quercetin dioxygenase-like cupin family protein
MKVVFVSLLLLSTAPLLTAAAVDGKVTFISHDKIPKNGTIISAPDFTVLLVTRYSRGEVEVHDKETDTFHVMEGSATIVTGDVIAVPAGVPHWFKEVPQSVRYYVVKVIKH